MSTLMRHYKYEVEGTEASGQTWKIEGTVSSNYPDVFRAINAAVFMRLTSGIAVFGHPGVGCKGPYNVTSLYIKQRPIEDTLREMGSTSNVEQANEQQP